MTKTRVALAASVALIGLLVTGCGPIGGGRLPALTQVEIAEVLATCLAQSGWSVEVRPDGGIATEFHESQASSYETALTGCVSGLGLDVPVQKLTDGEARELYALLLTSAACLREAGFEPSEPPSEQTWIDAYFVGVPWNPYADLVVADIDSVEYAAYFEACPVPSVRAG